MIASDSVRPVAHLALLLFVLTAQVGVELGVDGDHEAVQPVLDINIVLEIHIHALTSTHTIAHHIARGVAGHVVASGYGPLTPNSAIAVVGT